MPMVHVLQDWSGWKTDHFKQNSLNQLTMLCWTYLLNRFLSSSACWGLTIALNISCFQMSYEDESFKSAIDKGTLDALLPDTEHIDIAMSMLTDVWRVVKCMGSYMIVSLAQDHVLQTLVKSFQEKWAYKINSWLPKILLASIKFGAITGTQWMSHSDVIKIYIFAIVSCSIYEDEGFIYF